MKNFETILEGSAAEHGHLCAGQVIGVRMSLLGLKLIELAYPVNNSDIKKLIVYVEIDRCATDAIAYVTGVKPGRRSLKFKDYGIMAATFINTQLNRAFRIISTETSRGLADTLLPGITNKATRQLEAYKQMPLEELFDVFEVTVDIPESELPGPSRFKAVCATCGIVVRDGREISQGNKLLCHYCAGLAYYHDPIRISIHNKTPFVI